MRIHLRTEVARGGRLALLAIGLVLPGCTEPSAPPAAVSPPAVFAPRSPIGFVKGHSWGFPGMRGSYSGDDARRSLEELKATGAEWICLAFGVDMPSAKEPVLTFGDANSHRITDAELTQLIELAHQLGLRVILKPMVQCADGSWRATIDFLNAEGTRDADAWGRWWTQFHACLAHYGRIAAATRCEAYCAGCEMKSTQDFETEWRQALQQVRQVYQGTVTYDVNFDIPEFPVWFDALDLISLSAYYHIGVEDVRTKNWKGDEEVDWQLKPTVEEKAEYLGRLVDGVERQAARFNLPVLFIETGVCSAAEASRHPWSHENQVKQVYDGQEQADFYEAMCRAMWDRPWFVGFCWWSWPVKLPPRGTPPRIDFSIYDKPAEQVVRRWYALPTPDR